MGLIKEWWRLIICILFFSVGSTIMALSESDTVGRKIGGILVICTFIIPIYYVFAHIPEKK